MWFWAILPDVFALVTGLLVWRTRGGRLEFLLGHPGGPHFVKKDAGVWSIPKGPAESDEELIGAARREFLHQTGLRLDSTRVVPLGAIEQEGAKRVHAWATQADLQTSAMVSNTIAVEFPPGSGLRIKVPELDRLEYLAPEEARTKILPAQTPLLERALELADIRDIERR